MGIRKICKASESDLSMIDKILRRCDLESYNDKVRVHLKDGSLFVIKDRFTVLGLMMSSRGVRLSLFPESRDFDKEEDILELIHHKDEGVRVLELIVVDPMYQGKGIGKEALSFLLSYYPKTAFLAVLGEDDPKDFFKSSRYLDLGEREEIETRKKGPHLYLKPYIKDGLASWNF